jgi:hypothetical protein
MSSSLLTMKSSIVFAPFAFLIASAAVVAGSTGKLETNIKLNKL